MIIYLKSVKMGTVNHVEITYGVLFEIDTKKKDWIDDMFKYYGGLQCLPIIFKPINLPTEELERMKSNILEYIQETYID